MTVSVSLDLPHADIRIGGLDKRNDKQGSETAYRLAYRVAAGDGFRILLGHHPEYYAKYLKGLDIDLYVGSAHGGPDKTVRTGAFSPSQGFLPEFTSGIHDGRLVIGCGLWQYS